MAKGTAGSSLLFCLPHTSAAGKRVREENRKQITVPVSRGSRRALEWIDKEIPIKRLPAKCIREIKEEGGKKDTNTLE